MSYERTAIVTGGASGIGLAISERLAVEGNAVAVFDLNGEAARAIDTHQALIADEVLATQVTFAAAPEGAATDEVAVDEAIVRVGLKRAG
jgi:NAD(P)-dependent dehydrogenase (short-subunit alcohol dehydrogenase family)